MRTAPRPATICALAAALTLPAGAAAAGGSSVQPKIVGGSTASISTYPWQAGVVYSSAQLPGSSPQQRLICGGELITSRIVLTAGHCVADTDPDCGPNALSGGLPACSGVNDPGGDGTELIDPNDVDAILGRTSLDDNGAGAEAAVQAVKLGTGYDGNYQGNAVPRFDAAYLVLSTPSAQTPIKLVGTDETALWDAGSPEDISGWGSTSEFGTPVNTLRAASVDVIPDSTCTGDYGSNFDAGTMVCAGFANGGTDTCFGDSGGPLEAPLQGSGYRLVGITGWGEGCAEPGSPGVYTRIGGPTMRSLIASDVSNLETAQGLPQENIFGSGGQPRSSVPASGTGSRSTPSAKARKKCKRLHSQKKRRRCRKKARARAV